MQTGLPFTMQINCHLSIVETHREHDGAETLPLMSISVGTYSQISLSSMTFQCSAAWGLNGKKMTMVFYNSFFFFLWFVLFINEDILQTFVWVFILIIFELSMPKGEHFQKTNRINKCLEVLLNLFYAIVHYYIVIL